MERKLKNVMQRPGNYSRNVILGILVSIVLSFISWTVTTVGNSTLDCTQSTCKFSKISTYSIKNDIENLDMSFKLFGSQIIYSGQNLGAGKINLFYNANALTLFIPMRDGNSPAFPIVLPNTSDGASIHVRIVSSQVFSVFENDILVYTHRYQIPVFFVDPGQPISNNMISHITKLNFNLGLQHSSPYKTLWAFTVYFLSAIYIGAAIALRSQKRSRKSPPSLAGFPFLFAVLLWTMSIIRWLSHVSDDTSVSRPGPFGPVGPFFSDVYQVLQAGASSNPFTYNATDYPPFAVAIGQITRILPTTFLVFLLFGFTVFLYALPVRELFSHKSTLNSLVLLGTLIFSYPILFGVLRGNFDLLAVALTLAAFYEYQNERFIFTVTFLSLAVALKYWPVLFILIFIKNRQFKLTLKTASLAFLLTLFSSAIFEYGNIKKIFRVIVKPLVDYGSGSNGLSGYAFSYSMGSIFLLMVLVFTAQHPLAPTKLESQHALTISQGLMHLIFIILFLIILIFLIKKCKRLSSLFLYISATTLLIPSTSATYRAGILVACLIIRALEGERNIWRFMYQRKLKIIERNKLRIFKLLEAVAWLFILAPSDFYYQPNTFFSTASVLQPLSVCLLIVVEYSYDLQSRRTLSTKSFRVKSR